MASSPLSVAVDANALAWGWGGIPKVTQRIAAELAALDGVGVTLLANTSAPFPSVDGASQAFARRKGGALWRQSFVRPWLRRHRPDVFWAPETVVPRSCPVPSVVTVHDLAPLLLPGVKPRRHELLFRTGVRRSVLAADRVVAVSQTTARDVARLWPVREESIRVVPLGVDDAFRPGDRAAAAARVREEFGLEQPFVLYVGALEKRKGLPVLIEAAAAAARTGEPWRLVLAGTAGHGGGELERTARAAGCALLGPVDEAQLVSLYRAAEALAAPSLYEGFGLTPLEAMACGAPAVVAAGAGALEETAGPAAVVVGERTATAWLDGIRRAIDDRAALAERGLAHAARFRWPEVGARMLDVLREAAELSRRPEGRPGP